MTQMRGKTTEEEDVKKHTDKNEGLSKIMKSRGNPGELALYQTPKASKISNQKDFTDRRNLSCM